MSHLDPISYSRRQVLIAGGLGTIGLSLSQLLQAEQRGTTTSPGKSMILILPWGGPSQHDTFDPKPDAPAEIRSIFSPISTRTTGLLMGEHLPKLAERSHRFAVLRAISHSISTHNPATHLVLTGYLPRVVNQELTKASREDHPTLGAVLAKTRPSSGGLPSYIQLPLPMIDNGAFTPGQTAGFLGAAFDPLVVTQDPKLRTFTVAGTEPLPDLGQERSDARRALLRQLEPQMDAHAERRTRSTANVELDGNYERAFGLLRSAADQRAFDFTKESDRMRERYGQNRLGQSILVARRLIEAGVRLVLVADTTENTNGKWDTHSGFAKDLHLRYRESDQALSALLDDLGDRGLLDATLVAWMGEFGRTPNRKPDGGRDHWPKVYSAMLAGGGIRGGRVLGSSDSLGGSPKDGRVGPEDVLTTIYHLLGVPLDTEVHDPLNRPHRICTGSVIRALL